MEKLKSVLSHLSKNPLSNIREISDNALGVKINYNTTCKIIQEQILQKKVAEIYGYYYIIPSINQEIPFLIKITNFDKIKKPKFKKIKFTSIGSNPNFQSILKKYIALVNLENKIPTSSKKSKISPLISYGNKALTEYLRIFRKKQSVKNKDFHTKLLMHLLKKYDTSSVVYDEIKAGGFPLEEKLDMLSIWFQENNPKWISEKYGYKSNKFPRKIISRLYHKNGNPRFEKLLLAVKTGKVTKKLASKIFVQWILRLNAPNLQTKRAQQKFQRNIKKNYSGWDILKQGDIKSFDIS